MKICILATMHYPDDMRVFHKESKSLVAAGHDVTYVCASDTPVSEQVDGVHMRRIPIPRGLPQRCIAMLRLISEGLRVPADVYMPVEVESWLAALLIKLWTRRKVLFDVHEYFPDAYAKHFPSFLRSFNIRLIAWMMRIMTRFTDRLILTKECLRPDFEGLGVPAWVVLNTNRKQPPCADIPQALRDRYGNRPTIIHQGIFGDARGSYQLLEAMKTVSKEIPDVKCICLGAYKYGNEQAFLKALRDSGMDQYIEMLPVVPFRDVPAHIAVARVGLILFQPIGLEHTYGMPHKMFDYMREGIPVIAPEFAIEIKNVIAGSDCGLLIDVTDPRAIADAILFLLRNPEEAKRLGDNGRRVVETKYNWEAEEKKLLEAFASLEEKQARNG